ncbi:MAG: sigma-70 family RNA polymerase sigma factor [Planctomycetota bacterium]
MADPLHDELTRHAQALRGLARDLLRDGHAAEDVAQQTMQQALVAGSRLQPGPLGGWLQRTLRNFSLQWRRTERRRAAREARFAAATGLDGTDPRSPAETLARREMLQAVTDAVLRLDEPYQTVVFLRYFEDLPPRAIARRTGAPVATVKSQLSRGLVQVRQRMTASRGREWRPALGLVFGLPLGATLIPLTGALLVKTSIKIAAAAVVLVGVGVYLLDQHSAVPAPQQQGQIGQRDRISSAEASSTLQDDTQGVERTAIEADGDDLAWLQHPYAQELEVLVLDSTGLPVADHRPELAPLDGRLRDADVATGPDGVAVIRWSSRTPRVEVEVLDTRRHRRRVALHSGVRTRIVLVREIQQAGPQLAFGSMFFNEVVADDARPRRLAKPRNSDGMLLGLHPFAVFSENGIVVDSGTTPATTEARVSFNLDRLTTGSFEVLGDGGKLVLNGFSEGSVVRGLVTEDRRESEAPPSLARVEGVVYGEDGKPAAKVPVVLLGDGPQPLQRTRTDEQGAFVFERVQPGDVVVRAGGESEGLARNPLHVEGGTWRSNLQLRRDGVVRGVVRDADGRPVAGAGVEWHADDKSWADRTNTDAEGRFVLANLPGGTGGLSIWPSRNESGFPATTVPNVFVNPGELAVELPPATQNGFKVVVQTPDGLSGNHQPRVRVRQVETGFSRTMKAPDDPYPAWHLADLPVGNYEVAIWMPGAGAVPLGHHWLGADTWQDLGTVELPRPGRVTFSLPDDAPLPSGLEAEIVQLRPDFDVRYEILRGFADPILMPAGDYAMSTRIEGRTVQTRRFRLTAGSSTEVPVAW